MMEAPPATTPMEDCCVKVAVHIRPLIGDEKLQACKDCVAVVPGKPQVQLGTHSFTFDHVYGSTGSPSSSMFEECVSPLVDGLLQGYNATVLAYGQTGSGKTYTMGTGFKDGYQAGLIPQAMSALFNKVGSLQHQIEFQLHVSFIEILKEEVRDLLDPNSSNKSEITNGQTGKVNSPGKPPIQIRETSSGVITLAGSTECSVKTLKEMTDCLEHGSLSRATGSTNMNNQSSRSHAIFTITLEQMRKPNSNIPGDGNSNDSTCDEYLCAKLHLVDLAGSERAKRTGSDGMRFKEGVHINKGLLALGNVISALGDEKKRKEGAHVPYRDSKLTRLLQDSLGGNSRTVMIACVSPADINAEETLNTLKYANRARNIQNKPVVNRDPVSSEMLKMRQQLECLQAELGARGGGSSVELQGLRERIAWLEATNQELCRELREYRSRAIAIDQSEKVAKVGDSFCMKNDGFKRGLQSVDSSDYQMRESGDSGVIEEEAAKEWEHTLLQDSMDKELLELNKRLEQKESEMRLFEGSDTMTLKQHFGKKIMELEDEKRAVQIERDRLFAEVENLSASSDGQTQKVKDMHSHKLKSLESQIQDLKKKQESQVLLLKQKQKSDEAAKRLQDEIHFIKAQKVQLQHKIKQEAEQFRHWKASREKELLQLKKEGRRNEYERHKLQALNQRQKMVLQRKTEEAAMATKRLKELLEARKSTRDNSVTSNTNGANGQNNEKALQRWLDHELEVMVNVHEVRHEYGKQSQVRAALAEELAVLRQVDGFASKGVSPPRGKNGFSRACSLSPNARMARISSLENMLSISSNSLVSMASQLSEAEERERAFASRGRWNQLRSMADAKNLLQYMFNSLADARCQSWEKDLEMKEMEEQLKELVGLLRQSELRRKEVEKELKVREQTVAIALASSASLKYTAGIANGLVRESASFLDQKRKMVPVGQLSLKKSPLVGHSPGKLWRWKRSHHQWLLQFKWKWQKPWRLSELIKHSDETMMRAKPRPQPLPEVMYHHRH
ncbi:Kinesin, motor domain-containing protein [Cynara cardunculus var. scolymus]|uniref:Kinesin, motor domain-containing protein n=1 Tax=Cynara cardunculus var. scolymus TaxID=59895 RepID=A0A103XWR0_CYNCS|nr:Kinesin, motor domain-containing protein [Cynara cardunculus var. scolymus]